MLASLTISNIVLIEKLTLSFKDGLCALTGETGAGKSILLDSLGLALGMRAEAGLVRKGTDQASVTALFDVPQDHDVLTFLKMQDLEGAEDLILRRVMNADGRSRAFINDQPVSVSMLKQVGAMLVEIHGQFETQSLLSPKVHRGLLDDYGTSADLLHALADAWQDWQTKKEALEQAQEQIKAARENESYLRTAIEDLDALDPKAQEEEHLTQIRQRLMRREQMLEALNTILNGLDQSESALGDVWRSFERLDESSKEMSEGLSRAVAEMQEVRSLAQSLNDDLNENDMSLTEIDDRLYALKTQARKHDCTIEDLPQKRADLAVQLDMIDAQDDHLAQMIKKVESAGQTYLKQAEKVNMLRAKSAKKLDGLIAQELGPLKMDKARFVTQIDSLEEHEWGPLGTARVQFLISTNPGAAPGPLHKIASGGELSRFMLALKVVLADVGIAGAMIFDEVDSGIGGATAAAVGERLSRLSQHRQILVVTHSPQVAAMADHHYIVRKEGDKVVNTTVVALEQDVERTEEIARMLSASEITDEARAAANKLIQKKAV